MQRQWRPGRRHSDQSSIPAQDRKRKMLPAYPLSCNDDVPRARRLLLLPPQPASKPRRPPAGGLYSLGSDDEEEAPSIVLATQGLPAAGSR